MYPTSGIERNRCSEPSQCLGMSVFSMLTILEGSSVFSQDCLYVGLCLKAPGPHKQGLVLASLWSHTTCSGDLTQCAGDAEQVTDAASWDPESKCRLMFPLESWRVILSPALEFRYLGADGCESGSELPGGHTSSLTVSHPHVLRQSKNLL